MRAKILIPFAISLLLAAWEARGQTPVQAPPGMPVEPAPSPFQAPPPLPSHPPPVPFQPPFPAAPIAAPQPPAPMVAPPEAPESRPIDLAGRVGFGLGIWGIPAALAGPGGGLGSLGTAVGGALSIRAWASDRLVLIPSLSLSISRRSIPSTDEAGNRVDGGRFTLGAAAPALTLGYAAYRGKHTRFIVSAGLSFRYQVDTELAPRRDEDGTFYSAYQVVKTVNFAVPFGLALEQFFSPRISIVLGASSPLFSFSSTRSGSEKPVTSIGADFASTRLEGSVVFYTD